MSSNILSSLQKKKCSLTRLLGINTNPAHNTCAHYQHWDLSHPIHVVFLCPFNFLNILSSFDSHIVLYSQHFAVTFFFGGFDLSVVFFAFPGRLCTFVLATFVLFFFLFSFFCEFFTGVFLVIILLTGWFDGCPCCVPTVLVFLGRVWYS